MGEAEVHLQGNNICFTITNKEFQRGPEKMTYQGYLVSEKAKIVWGYSIKSTIFKEGDCYSYGILPAGAEVNNADEGEKLPEKAPPLQVNTLYSVSVHAGTNIPTDPTHGYHTYFCLHRGNDSIAVQQGYSLKESSCSK